MMTKVVTIPYYIIKKNKNHYCRAFFPKKIWKCRKLFVPLQPQKKDGLVAQLVRATDS